MKKFGSLLLAIALVAGVLVFVKADVNHGHGPADAGEHGDTTVTTDSGAAPAAH